MAETTNSDGNKEKEEKRASITLSKALGKESGHSLD